MGANIRRKSDMGMGMGMGMGIFYEFLTLTGWGVPQQGGAVAGGGGRGLPQALCRRGVRGRLRRLARARSGRADEEGGRKRERSRRERTSRRGGREEARAA